MVNVQDSSANKLNVFHLRSKPLEDDISRVYQVHLDYETPKRRMKHIDVVKEDFVIKYVSVANRSKTYYKHEKRQCFGDQLLHKFSIFVTLTFDQHIAAP